MILDYLLKQNGNRQQPDWMSENTRGGIVFQMIKVLVLTGVVS
jgi:hypothetical protein